MRQEALQMVYELAKKDERVVFLGSDLGVGVLQKFKEEMPSRFIMEGISEQHLVGMAAGMAMEGHIVYANTIATFLTRRSYEQVVLDMCLHNLNVRLIANGGGLVYAPLGPTHLAIEDMAILRTLPNMTIIAPADPEEMCRLVPQTLNIQGPVYIRVAKGGEAVVTPSDKPCEIGKAVEVRDGKDVLLITTGVALHVALDAAKVLASEGKEATVLHFHTVKPFDLVTLKRYVNKIPAIISIEEGVITGGLGSAVAEYLAELHEGPQRRFRRIGIPDRFPDKYGSQASLMEYCGISPERVVATARELLSRWQPFTE